MQIKRNILLNPGPATTTDTVKMAQIVPDICPREKEFASMMKKMREDLVRIVHGDLNKYTSVLFCGSGTLNIPRQGINAKYFSTLCSWGITSKDIEDFFCVLEEALKKYHIQIPICYK